MLKEVYDLESKEDRASVLILILMEHAQRVQHENPFLSPGLDMVLILILMEHAQRVGETNPHLLIKATRVLILILMEHAQRVAWMMMPTLASMQS